MGAFINLQGGDSFLGVDVILMESLRCTGSGTKKRSMGGFPKERFVEA